MGSCYAVQAGSELPSSSSRFASALRASGIQVHATALCSLIAKLILLDEILKPWWVHADWDIFSLLLLVQMTYFCSEENINLVLETIYELYYKITS